MKLIKMAAWMLPIVFLLASCAENELYTDNNRRTDSNRIEMRLSLRMPAAVPRSYSISAIDENQIDNIDVLSFKASDSAPSGWEFVYAAEGKSITDEPDNNDTKAKKSFTATLIKDADKSQKLVVLANVHSIIEQMESDGMAQGADMDAMLARVVEYNASSWNANNDNSATESDPDRFRPFPMWGQTASAVIIDDNTTTSSIGTIGLVRSVARVDVVLGTDVISADNFSIDEVYVYNSKNRGYVVPNQANLENIVQVNKATVPADAGEYASWNNSSPLHYTVPVSMSDAFESTIYLFEAKGTTADKASDATCLVVGGTYGNDAATTYYRVDFLKLAPTDSYYRDVLRNYHYRINITEVSGRGYATEEEAFNSGLQNMHVDVVGWSDGGTNDVVFDGQHYLEVSPPEILIPRSGSTDSQIFVTTDVDTGWSINWSGDGVTDSPVEGGTHIDWIHHVSGEFGEINVKDDIVFSVDENTSGLPRVGYIHIETGRLAFAIRVVQSEIDLQNYEITITNEQGIEVSELYFGEIYTTATPIPTQSFTVQWEPTGVPLRMAMAPDANDSIKAIYTPDIGHGSQTLEWNPDGHTFTIAPQHISEPTPFIQHTTRFYFELDTDNEPVVKSLTARQETILFIPPSYITTAVMNGQPQILYYRANFPWRFVLPETVTGQAYVDESDPSTSYQKTYSIDQIISSFTPLGGDRNIYPPGEAITITPHNYQTGRQPGDPDIVIVNMKVEWWRNGEWTNYGNSILYLTL